MAAATNPTLCYCCRHRNGGGSSSSHGEVDAPVSRRNAPMHRPVHHLTLSDCVKLHRTRDGTTARHATTSARKRLAVGAGLLLLLLLSLLLLTYI